MNGDGLLLNFVRTEIQTWHSKSITSDCEFLKTETLFFGGCIPDLILIFYLPNRWNMRNKICHHIVNIHLIVPEHHAIWLFQQSLTFPMVALHDTRINVSCPVHRCQSQWHICRYSSYRTFSTSSRSSTIQPNTRIMPTSGESSFSHTIHSFQVVLSNSSGSDPSLRPFRTVNTHHLRRLYLYATFDEIQLKYQIR